MIIPFEKIIADLDFRKFLNTRLQKYQPSYGIFIKIPLLYRYQPLKEYAIKNILENELQLSSISVLNDSFEGNMRIIKDEQELTMRIQKRSATYQINRQHGCPDFYTVNEIEKLEHQRHVREQYLYSNLLKNTGNYVGSFSENYSSTLMWSHYADSHRGICIEYEFNLMNSESDLSNMLFPVCYTNEPIYVGDLVKDKTRSICKYPLDAAVTCALLNKSDVWAYEKEWRLFCSLNIPNRDFTCPRIKIKSGTPEKIFYLKSITLGCHFLQNFCGYNIGLPQQNCAYNFKSLLSFLIDNSISTYYMMPVIGSFHLKRKKINPKKLLNFFSSNFFDNNARSREEYQSILWFWLQNIM